MAIPFPGSSSSSSVQSGLVRPLIWIDSRLLNLLYVGKIDKLNSGGWKVMFYTAVTGAAVGDGYAISVADEAAADAMIVKIKKILQDMGALSDYTSLP